MSWTDYASAPAPGTPICPESEVGTVHSVQVATPRGSFPLLIARTDAGLRAYVNACPHQYLPLDYRGPQILSADGARLMCTAHGASFDIGTGAALAGAPCGLEAVPVESVAGMIRIAAG